MKIIRNIFAGALLIMFAMSVTAGEDEQMNGHMPAFSDFDLDGDGAIVEQEFNKGHAKRMSERAAEGHELKNAGKCTFAGIDSDSDGAVTPEEFKAHKARHMGKGKHKCKDKENCKHKHMHKHKHEMKEKTQDVSEA